MKLTDDVILIEVESLIEDFRPARGFESDPKYRTYHALKAVASDIRGRKLSRLAEAQRELAAALAAMERSNATNEGFATSTQIDLALKTRAYWPTIRRALEAVARTKQVVEDPVIKASPDLADDLGPDGLPDLPAPPEYRRTTRGWRS